jgi:hypothetical protein
MIFPREPVERATAFREVVIAWVLAAIMLAGPALISLDVTDAPTDNFIASRLAVPTYLNGSMPGRMEEHDASAICDSDSPDEERIVPCPSRQVAGLRTQTEDGNESEVC